MDNVSFKYVSLASLSVQQPFYANRVCGKFSVDPDLDFELYSTTECVAVMRRLDILVRPAARDAGLLLFVRALGKNGAGDDLMRFPAGSTDKLTFWMQLRHPDVLNFDDLPTAIDPTKLFYFTNQHVDAAAPRDDLHLTAGAGGVNAVDDGIASSSEHYTFHHTSAVAAGDAKVKHLLTGKEIAPTSIVVVSGQSDLTFELSALPLGKCELSITGASKDTFYYTGHDAQPAFGVIELVLANSLPANYRMIEPDRSLSAARPRYTVLLPNRRTRWRYMIHLQPNSPISVEMAKLSPADKADFLDRLRVTTNDGAVTFTRGTTTDTDIVFVSDTDLALQERYISSTSTTQDPLSLTLKKYVGVAAKEAVVRSDLPYPHSLIDARATPVIYSDTFLTL